MRHIDTVGDILTAAIRILCNNLHARSRQLIAAVVEKLVRVLGYIYELKSAVSGIYVTVIEFTLIFAVSWIGRVYKIVK